MNSRKEKTLKKSQIRNFNLAQKGKQKIEWVKEHMPVLNYLEKRLRQERPFENSRIAVCIHLEAKTAYMAEVLHKAGAEVVICGSNPLSTQDDIAASLVKKGITVYSWYGATPEEYDEHVALTASSGPDLILDDGGDLVNKLHTDYQELLSCILGGSEETTTGVNRLRIMEEQGELSIPMFAVNDAHCKYLFDNRYGTGQSTWAEIMSTTNLVVAGKTVVVAGYGWCGRGVAMRASGLGAKVIVCEVDPIRANEALMDGYRVMPMSEAARKGDFFITVTGCRDVITGKHFEVMKDGAICCNAGHFDLEIDVDTLAGYAEQKREVKENITEYMMPDGRSIYLLAQGRLVNLASGSGHPAEIMDMSFALQVLTLRYIRELPEDKLSPGLFSVPHEIDYEVANLRLKALGIGIDSLSEDQKDYLSSWR